MLIKTIIGPIKITPEREKHIIDRHPIMEDYLSQLKAVLRKPDSIHFSSYSNAVLLFYRYFDKIENGKYIVVVVNKKDGEVKTAYLSHRIKSGRKYEKE